MRKVKLRETKELAQRLSNYEAEQGLIPGLGGAQRHLSVLE